MVKSIVDRINEEEDLAEEKRRHAAKALKSQSMEDIESMNQVTGLSREAQKEFNDLAKASKLHETQRYEAELAVKKEKARKVRMDSKNPSKLSMDFKKKPLDESSASKVSSVLSMLLGEDFGDVTSYNVSTAKKISTTTPSPNKLKTRKEKLTDDINKAIKLAFSEKSPSSTHSLERLSEVASSAVGKLVDAAYTDDFEQKRFLSGLAKEFEFKEDKTSCNICLQAAFPGIASLDARYVASVYSSDGIDRKRIVEKIKNDSPDNNNLHHAADTALHSSITWQLSDYFKTCATMLGDIKVDEKIKEDMKKHVVTLLEPLTRDDKGKVDKKILANLKEAAGTIVRRGVKAAGGHLDATQESWLKKNAKTLKKDGLDGLVSNIEKRLEQSRSKSPLELTGIEGIKSKLRGHLAPSTTQDVPTPSRNQSRSVERSRL